MNIKVIFFFLMVFYLVEQARFKKYKTFDIMKYESCKEYPSLPMQVSWDKKKNYGKNNRFLEMIMKVDKEIGGYLEGTINLWKCDSTGSPDSCEYYVKDLKVKKICEKIPMKDQAWSKLIEGTKPPLGCPIKPQTYEIGLQISDDVFKYLPVPTGVWRARGFMYKDNETVLCLDFDSKVTERRA